MSPKPLAAAAPQAAAGARSSRPSPQLKPRKRTVFSGPRRTYIHAAMHAGLGVGMSLLTLSLTACAKGPQTGVSAPELAPVQSEGKPAPALALAIDGKHPERIKLAWQINIGGPGVAVAVERGAGVVAAVARGGPVKLYDYWTGKSKGVSASCTDVLRSGVFMTQGRLVVVCESRLELFQVRGIKELPAPKLAESRATAAALAWPWLAVGHHDGVLRIYNLTDQSLREIPVPGPPIDVKSLALTRDGNRLAVAWVQGSIWWWDIAEPGHPNPLVRYENESDALAFDASGKWLAEEGEKKLTSVWSFGGEPARMHQRPSGSWVKRFWFSPKADWLFRGGSHGVDLIELATEKAVTLTGGLVEDLALDGDGTSLAAVDRDGTLSLWVGRP